MIKTNLQMVLRRFPVSFILIILLTALFYTLLHWDYNSLQESHLLRGIFTSIVTFFFSLWVYLTTESRNIRGIKKQLIQFIPIVFGIFLFIAIGVDIDSFEAMVFLFLAFFGIFFYLFCAPYLKSIFSNTTKQTVFYTYFYNMSVVFLMSFILGWVLVALWSIGITAVFELFDVRDILSNDIYADWFILALACITPIFALTKIPEKRSFAENYFNENAFFSFLIKYIAIPFISIYFIILYAYSIKVLSNFGDWPKWEVSWMVIWFSIFGYITYIFSYIFENKNKFIKVFRKYFPYAVIPQIFMLFYAIYLRIHQYDLTVNRYLVVVFWIWLLCISLYYIFSKRKSLPIIPALLTVFTIVISVGPWSVHELPEYRQIKVLKQNLTQANILQDGKIIPLESYTDIDKNLSKNIHSGIDYLCDFDNCESIKTIFADIYAEELKIAETEYKNNKYSYITDEDGIRELPKFEWMSRWEITRKITEAIKVKTYHSYDENLEESLYLYKNYKDSFFPLDVSWYSKMLEFGNSNYISNEKIADFNVYKNVITIKYNSELLVEIDASDIILELQNSYKRLWSRDFSKENMIFEITHDNKKYKLFLDNINIPNPLYTGHEENWRLNANGFILIQD